MASCNVISLLSPERAGLLSVTALLQLLALSGIFDNMYEPSLAGTVFFFLCQPSAKGT